MKVLTTKLWWSLFRKVVHVAHLVLEWKRHETWLAAGTTRVWCLLISGVKLILTQVCESRKATASPIPHHRDPFSIWWPYVINRCRRIDAECLLRWFGLFTRFPVPPYHHSNIRRQSVSSSVYFDGYGLLTWRNEKKDDRNVMLTSSSFKVSKSSILKPWLHAWTDRTVPALGSPDEIFSMPVYCLLLRHSHSLLFQRVRSCFSSATRLLLPFFTSRRSGLSGRHYET